LKSLQDKRALVTGAGAGIGRAIATAIADAGGDVIITDIDEASAKDAAHAIGGAAYQHDVTDADRWATLADEIGPLDILVNNAGVHTFGAFAEQPREDFEWQVAVNFDSVVYGCRAFLPQLRDGGHIVNLSSLAGTVGLPSQSAYCASKFAVRGFTAALRGEQASRGVGVSAILPGTVSTGILRKSRSLDQAQTDQLAQLMERHGVPPASVAQRVLRAIRRNQAEVFIGVDCHATQWTVRLAPWLMRWSLAKLYARYTT